MAKDLTIFGALQNIAKRKDVGGGYVPTTPGGGWLPFAVREPFAGAWQHNIEYRRETVLAYHAVFSCITLIASDISKMPVRMVGLTADNIWAPIKTADRFKVLTKPNGFQTRIQFFESWINSKMIRGNAYILLGRNKDQRVVSMHVLNPDLVLPMVTPEGEVFYQLGIDNMSGVVEDSVIAPASDIIHDRFNCLFHPLVGLSPIYACGLAAYNGLKIQHNSSKFFQNMGRPSGILTAPGAIKQETAAALKDAWESNYTGDNYGRIAVLGDDMKYEALSLTAEESELVEQLRLTAEIVCSTFHVPKYKVLGDPPTVGNIEALEQSYYSQCLQVLIESIELLMDEGLNMPEKEGVEFDLDVLLRMDSKTQVETLSAAIKGGLDTPNEARKRRNQKPLPGGDTVWLQQQQWPMEVLAQRRNPPEDAGDPADDNLDPEDDDDTPPPDEENDDLDEVEEAALSALFVKELEGVLL